MISVVAGAVGAVLAVAVAWNQLDLPVPASHNDLMMVQQYAEGTRSIVLNDKWIAAEAKLRRAQEQYAQNPTDNLRQLVNHLTATLRTLQAQIDEMSR